MRFIEILNKIQIPVTNEEQCVLERIQNKGTVSKNDLTEREQYLANQLVNKSIIIRKKHHGNIIYKKSSSTSY